MTKRRTFDLVRSLGKAEAALRGQTFLAPLLPGSSARVRIQGLIYQFAIADAQPGWWFCQPIDARNAEVVEEAPAWARGDYLALWPTVHLVLIEQLNEGTWLALPNTITPKQPAGPVVVSLMDGGQPFERIIGRTEGHTIWYDDADHSADPSIAESLRNALSHDIESPNIKGLSAGERAVYALRFEQSYIGRRRRDQQQQEKRLRNALTVGGASLLGYERVSGNDGTLRVHWVRDGVHSTNLVDMKLNVISSGICLSGQDSDFDLASVVGVVAESPWSDSMRDRRR